MPDAPATGPPIAGPTSSANETPQPAAIGDQAASVDERANAIRKTVATQHEDALDSIRMGVAADLESTAEESAAAQKTARETFDAAWKDLRKQRETEAIPTDPSDVIRAYRHAVMETVLTPLHDTLHFVDAGAVFRGMRHGVKAARSALLADLPEQQERTEPDELYKTDEADSPWRSMRKAGVRGGRWAQSLVTTPSALTQTVPLTPLARYHLEHRLPHAEAPIWDDLEQAWAIWVARVERAAIQWSHQVLRAEAAFDLIDALPPTEQKSSSTDSTSPGESGKRSDSDAEADDTEEKDAEEKGGTEQDAIEQDATAEEVAEIQKAMALVDAMRTAGTELSQVLRAVPTDATDNAVDQLSAIRDDAHTKFVDDLNRSDSFMARREVDPEPPEVDDGQWVEWHREAVARLSVGLHLSAIRDVIWTEQESLAGAIVDAGISPVRQIMRDNLRRLRAFHEEVDALLTLPPKGAERRLFSELDRLLENTLDVLENELVGSLRQTTVRRDMDAVVQTRIDAINDAIDAQPEVFTIHGLDEKNPGRIDPDAPSQPVQWQSIVRETTAITLFDEWRAILPPVADTISSATTTANDVVGIVRFNLGAAIEELQDLMIARRRNDPDADHLDAARELALDGLDRAATLLSNADQPITSAGVPIAAAVRSTSANAWARVHERVQAAGRTRAQVLRVQTLTESYLKAASGYAQTTSRELSVRLRRALKLGQRRAEQIVQMGQSAVGTGGLDEQALQETVAAVITLEDQLQEMPLVYRRLFSLRPVRDPDLLVGRDSDLQRISKHVDQWQNGLPNALVLTGDPGSGLTSLVNVLSATVLRRSRRYTIDLTERFTSEEAIAAEFANGLGLTQEGLPKTLDELSQRILEQDTGKRLHVVFVEHLEHLFLRSIGGTGTLARVLELMSCTDSHIFWVGTMSGFGWQILKAHEPDSAGLVIHHNLAPFNRESIEELIIRRHRRSGLTLRFDPPSDSSQPILSRRLARADDEEEEQSILRTEYFDRLHGLCGQNVMLALFYWFRSVRMTDDGNGIRVSQVSPIRFDFLDAFPIQRSFALKALIDHATLTVVELADVLQIPHNDARKLLEALGNAQLIAPAETIGVPRTYAFDGVKAGMRYRVRPMVLHPVVRHLRSRNIVH